MLWIINGLIYGFFTALYMLFNQHYRVNGYILGIWRGFGIFLLFVPSVFFFPAVNNITYWGLLILQGLLIGIYDSHLFFASFKYGAGATSRFMAITVLLTTFIWWALTPQKFSDLVNKGEILVTLILVLCGFTYCYWQMLQNRVSRQAAEYIMPAVISLSAMCIITKYIAIGGLSIWQALAYYLTVSTFVSGCYNLLFYLSERKNTTLQNIMHEILSRRMIKIGTLLVLFSVLLIVAKTLALRIAPNPGYVASLLLVAPLFVMALNNYHKVDDNVSVKEGLAMLFFLFLLVFLVNGSYGIAD